MREPTKDRAPPVNDNGKKRPAPKRRVKVEPAIVVRLAKQPDTTRLIAAAHLKRHQRKLDRFSLVGLREVENQGEAEKWARRLAKEAGVVDLEIEQDGQPLDLGHVDRFR